MKITLTIDTDGKNNMKEAAVQIGEFVKELQIQFETLDQEEPTREEWLHDPKDETYEEYVKRVNREFEESCDRAHQEFEDFSKKIKAEYEEFRNRNVNSLN